MSFSVTMRESCDTSLARRRCHVSCRSRGHLPAAPHRSPAGAPGSASEQLGIAGRESRPAWLMSDNKASISLLLAIGAARHRTVAPPLSTAGCEGQVDRLGLFRGVFLTQRLFLVFFAFQFFVLRHPPEISGRTKQQRESTAKSPRSSRAAARSRCRAGSGVGFRQSQVTAPYFVICLPRLFARTRRRDGGGRCGRRSALVGASMPFRLILRLNSLVRCWFLSVTAHFHQLGVLQVGR